jgi:transcriptional regulator with XRE-family HTH domain
MTSEELTTLRTGARLSKFALAKATGISRARVGDFEAGRRPITATMAARLREALRARRERDA